MKGFLVFSFPLLIFSCTQQKEVDSKAVAEEMKNREIKRVTSSEIFAKVGEIGEKNFKKFQVCVSSGYFTCLDSLSKTKNQEAKIYPLDSNLLLGFSEKRKQVFDSYLYNKGSKYFFTNSIQQLSEDSILYTQGFAIKNKRILVDFSQDSDSLFVFMLTLAKSEVLKSF